MSAVDPICHKPEGKDACVHWVRYHKRGIWLLRNGYTILESDLFHVRDEAMRKHLAAAPLLTIRDPWQLYNPVDKAKVVAGSPPRLAM